MSNAGEPAATYVVVAQFRMPMELRADPAPVPRAEVPTACECLLCLLVQTEFQKDRLGDFEELYHKIWLPKFGPRLAWFPYSWNLMRQCRIVDWIIEILFRSWLSK
jgi:hypothetical protein